MGIKCILLYKLPKGVPPVKEDAERIINALTQQLYCVPETGRSYGRDGSSNISERQLEASVSVFRQLQAADPSLISDPKSLKDIWIFKLHREAPNRVFMLIKPPSRGVDSSRGIEARVTEAEPSIRAFLEKRLDYRQRASIAVQSQAWHMGDRQSDVTVKLLQVLQQGQTPKVLAVELTYHPAAELAAALPVLSELAERVRECVGPASGTGPGQAGTLQLLQPRYDPDLPPQYGPMHIVEAYNELLVLGMSGR